MSVIIKIGGARTSPYNAEVQQQPTNPAQDNVEHQDVSPPPEEVPDVGVPISSGCFGLPYMDHNYGAPPPPSSPPAPPPPPARVNGQVVQDPASVPLPAKEETVDDSVTRCICEFQHDDGYMICCDKCSVWQHIDCMGIDRDNIPESYFCEQCDPRTVDVERARTIQSKKREELDTSATDTDPEEAANHLASLHKKAAAAAAAKGKAVKQKRTLSKNKERPPPRQKKKEKKIKKEKENIKEVLRKQKGSINGQVKEVVAPKLPKSKSRRKVGLEVDSARSYNSHERPMTGRFTRISSNNNSDEVIVMAAAMKLKGFPDKDELPFKKLSRSLVKVFDVRRGLKGLVANEDIISGTAIIEYIGYVTIKHCYGGETEEQKTYKPFVLLYSELEGLNLIIDASTMGNDARYVRRSCMPNAEVQHYFVRGNFHLVISSKQLIPKRSEITIPFDFDYKECPFPVECACLSSDCEVAKFWGQTKNSRSRSLEEKPQRTRRQSVTPAERKTQHRRNSSLPPKRASVELPAVEPEPVTELKLENVKQESEVVPATEPEPPRPRSSRRASSSSVAVETPLPIKVEVKEEPVPPPEAEEKKVEGTKHESGPECSSETDEASRKMTREERKMEAYVRAFEKMEKREVRRKEALARINKHAKEETKQTGEEVSEVPEASPAAAALHPEAHPESPHKVSRGKKSKRISRKRSRVHSVSAAASESEPPCKRSRVKSFSVVSEHALSQDESSSASTSIPSAPSTPVPSNPSPQASALTPSSSSSHPLSGNTGGEFLKVPRKKKLMMERQQDTKPGPGKTEPLEVAVEEAVYVTCLASPSNALERLQRRYSHSAGSHRSGDSGVAAKKRWLRQAMSNEGGSSSPLVVASSPSLVAQPHSPGSSPPHDFVTPLKKRRLARESLSQDQPSASCPSTPSPSQPGQGGLDNPGSPQDPCQENRLFQLAKVALGEEAHWAGMERVQPPGEPGCSSARSSQARVLVDGEREDRSETATFMPASQEVATTETTLIANYVDAELGRRASHEKTEETNKRRSTEANVHSSGQTGHPSTAESDAMSESRPKTPAEQPKDCSEEVSSLREPKPPDRVGCSSSVTDSSLSACTETSGVSESVVGVKDNASIMELKNLDSLESSSSSAQCRVNEEETETLRTDVLVDSPETCESGEERNWSHISSSQGFVPAGNWEDLQPASQQSTSSTGGPVEVDCSEREVSHGQSISSSGDVAEESRVCSSNSEAALEPVDSVEESGLCRPRSLREASQTGEETLASGGSLEVPREAASSATEESGAAPQECRVSSCSQDLSVEEEAGISSSHGRRSPGREAEGGECDSSVPGMGEVSRVEAPSRVRVPAWGEECGVDSTTQLWDRPSADPSLSPEVPSGTSRTPGRDAMRTPGEAQSAPPAQTSRVEARPGLETDRSPQTDSTSAQPSAKKKMSLLEYRKRRKGMGKSGSCPEVSASQSAAPFASPPSQELSLAEVPPTLKPLPLFNTSPPPLKPGPSNKAGGAGPGKRKEKQMSLSERLRLEFGLDDSVEEDKGQGDEDPDSGPNQQRMIPPPPPSTPYPGHLAGSCLPPAAPALNSHMLSLRAQTGGLPLRPSSPSSSSPLLPTPPPPPPPLHPSNSSTSPLLPFPGTPSVPSHINGGSGLPLPGPSKGPPSSFPRPPAPPYCPPMPPGFINTVPPPPPGLPTPLNRIPVAAPVGQTDTMALQRPGMGNGFVPNKRP